MIGNVLLTIWFAGFAGALALLASGLMSPTAKAKMPPTDRPVAVLATAFIFILAAAWPLLLLVILYIVWIESGE